MVRTAAAFQRYHDLFASAPDAYLVTDPAGVLKETNAAACALLGVRSHLLRRHLRDFLPAAARPAFDRCLTDLAAGAAPAIWPVRVQPPGRPPFDGELRPRLVRGPRGRLIEVRWSLRDASAQRQLELQVRTLLDQMTRVQQQERERLARVLHDSVQQLLVAARLRLAALTGRTPAAAVPLELDRINELLAETLQVTRSLALDLCPPGLHGRDLPACLQWLCDHLRRTSRLQVTLHLDHLDGPLEESRQHFLFQSAHELLLNVIKHARVLAAALTARRTPAGEIALTISDRGAGFAPATLADPDRESFGLRHLQERAALFGGRLDITSSPGQGAQITLLLPAASK